MACPNYHMWQNIGGVKYWQIVANLPKFYITFVCTYVIEFAFEKYLNAKER